MKIYSKKTFMYGISLFALGIANILFQMAYKRPVNFSTFLTVLIFTHGIFKIRRSMSLEKSKIDNVEYNDERNIYYDMKAKCKSLIIFRAMIYVSIAVLTFITAFNDKYELLIANLVLACVLVLSYLSQLIVVIYYEHHD